MLHERQRTKKQELQHKIMRGRKCVAAHIPEKNVVVKGSLLYHISQCVQIGAANIQTWVKLLLFIFRVVADIQQLNTNFMGHNSWSFYLSYIVVTYCLKRINKGQLRYIGDGSQMKTYISVI